MASNKDGSSYIDGVPVKISSKFVPPRPVSLPLALETKISTELLSEQYDFSLEKSVIEFSIKRQTELQEAVLAKSAKKDIPPETENSSSDTLSLKEPMKQNAQCVLSFQSDSILQPRPQQLPDTSCSSTINTKVDDMKINLSDFENDTSSPFDYMELQTINDLEELNSVFQGIHNRDSSNQTEVCKDESNTPIVATDPVSTVAKSVSFPLPQHSWQEPAEKISSSLSEDFVSSGKCVSLPSAYEEQREVSSSSSYPFASQIGNSASSPKEVKDFSCDNISYSTLSQVPYISSSAVSHSIKNSSEKTSPLRCCKSYSDIQSLPETEMINSMKQRSQTPPVLSSEVTKTTDSDEELPLDENYFAGELNESVNGVASCDNTAYEELTADAKRFVDCITEMGFAEGQVARAVKHLGMDEKKVVEHLCQIQALEESGYESSEAEAALHLHDYNREQAKAFLDLVIQFQDLGFEKDAVKKALVQNKNDWNKTIDALLP